MLDVITLLVIQLIFSLLFAVAQAVVWTAHKKETCMLWWAAGNFMGSAGVASFLAHDTLGTLPCLIVTNGLIVSSISFLVAGARSFSGQPVRPLWLIATVSSVVALAIFLHVTRGRMEDRVIVVSLALAVGCLMIAREMRRNEAVMTTFARRLASGLFLIGAGMYLGRAFIAVVSLNAVEVPRELMFEFSFVASSALLALSNFLFLYIVLERITLEDVLTGLSSRRALDVRGAALVRRAQKRRSPLAVVLFDLDQFKLINDTQGHSVGDQVLRSFADLLRSRVGSQGLIGRYGGDEFYVILPEHSRKNAIELAEDIRRRCSEKLSEVQALPLAVTVTTGVAVLEPDMTSIDDVLAAADAGLYQAKHAGRNAVGSITRNLVSAAPLRLARA
jgi:diguanylate cyclase (GGDEF)-like protein